MKKWSMDTMAIPELRRLAEDWMAKHDIDPRTVPVEGYVEKVDPNTVRVEVFLMGEHKRPVFVETPEAGPRPKIIWQEINGQMPPKQLLADLGDE